MASDRDGSNDAVRPAHRMSVFASCCPETAILLSATPSHQPNGRFRISSTRSGPSQIHPSQPTRRRDALSAFGKPTKVQMRVGLKMKHWFRHRPSQVLPNGPLRKGTPPAFQPSACCRLTNPIFEYLLLSGLDSVIYGEKGRQAAVPCVGRKRNGFGASGSEKRPFTPPDPCGRYLTQSGYYAPRGWRAFFN